MTKNIKLPPAKIKIESIQKLKFGDLDDLCDATESAIIEGGGFGWIKVPSRKVLENYWRGVLTIPERELIIPSVIFIDVLSSSLSIAHQ